MAVKVEAWRARCAARDIPLLLPGQTLAPAARLRAAPGQLSLPFKEVHS